MLDIAERAGGLIQLDFRFAVGCLADAVVVGFHLIATEEVNGGETDSWREGTIN